jgi:hypothetical protein
MQQFFPMLVLKLVKSSGLNKWVLLRWDGLDLGKDRPACALSRSWASSGWEDLRQAGTGGLQPSPP